tara:strand:+ start:433 stop:1176 length:744 start_codon:yes stop_codon:yes gene_type:complete
MIEEFKNKYDQIYFDDLEEIYTRVKKNHYILKCVDKKILKEIHKKALDDLNNSLPKYFSFEINAPNFRKSNYQHKKSVVNGYFEQYNYFPWNSNSNLIFEGLNKHLILFFEIANLYCFEKMGIKYYDQTGLSINKLFNEKYFIRICYQYFPNTKGYLSIHRDPVGSHQLAAPIVSLSEMKKNGLYYILHDEKINAQSIMSYGDSIYVDQSRLHAVEHDLLTSKGTEHFLISVHRYHSDNSFQESSTK